MEMYFLKSAACLAVLLLFYKLLLEKENMHVFKRFYLLASVAAAFLIPAITFTTYIEPSTEIFKQFLISPEAVSAKASANYWPNVLLGIYLSGVIFFGIKFIRNLRNLVLKIKRNQKIRQNVITNVLLSEITPPHTFFHYIFFNKQQYLRNEIPQDVKVHEEAHARQKHSLDVIFVELLQIIFWINPLIFLLKNAIKLNHEFLADRAVIGQGYKTADYQKTLLSYSSGDLQSDLVNPINYSSIKKRFTVMKTQTSKQAFYARSLMLLPLLAVLLYGFSTREVLERESNSASPVIENSKVLELSVDKEGYIFLNNSRIEPGELKQFDMEKYESYSINASPDAPEGIVSEIVQFGASHKLAGMVSVCNMADLLSDNEHDPEVDQQQVPQQKKATPQEIAEYNRLVKYYNDLPKNRLVLKQEDINKIMSIRNRMTPEQKKNAEKINFEVPPPPPSAPSPTPAKGKVPPPPVVEVVGFPAPPSPPAPPANTNENMPPLPPPVEVSGYPAPPPPPPPPTYEDLVEKGATFYYNGKLITPEEALRLVRVEKSVNIEVIDIDKKPIVRLTDKK